MTSSLVTSLAYILGLGAAALIVASLLGGERPRAQTWALAAAAVAVAVLAVGWPGKLRDSGKVLNDQRKTYAPTSEPVAKQKCLNDIGRPDLVEALAAARERMPEDAEYVVNSNTPVVPCLIMNMFPRRPLRSVDFDPERHWALFDGTAPEGVTTEAGRQAALAEPARRYLTVSEALILARPESEVSR